MTRPFMIDPRPFVYCGSGIASCVNLIQLELSGRTMTILHPEIGVTGGGILSRCPKTVVADNQQLVYK